MATIVKKVKKVPAKKPAAKAKKVAKKNALTLVALVVDRSGSMSSIYEACLSGVNEQLNTLKKSAKKNKTLVSVVQFDDAVETLYSRVDPKTITEFKQGDFSPRGVTAMRDGTWAAIQNLKAQKNVPADTGYLVIVISDGQENASKDISPEGLSAEIKKLEGAGQWTFTYMLANQDIYAATKTLGISAGNISPWTSTSAGVATAFNAMGDSTAKYFAGRGQGVMRSSTFYSNVTDADDPILSSNGTTLSVPAVPASK